MKIPVFTFSIILICCLPGLTQTRVIDSLKKRLKAEQEDTNKVNTLNKLSRKLEGIGKYDSSLVCSNQAYELANQVDFKEGIETAYSYMANVYDDKSDYFKAIDCDLKAITICRQIGDKHEVARILGNIGPIYFEMGNYPMALEYFSKALPMATVTGDSSIIDNDLSNMGLVYSKMGNYPMSLQYFLKALAMAQKIGEKSDVAYVLCNIANDYFSQGNYSKALEYDILGLSIAKTVDDKSITFIILGNMGDIYQKQGYYSKAFEYSFKALAMATNNEDKGNISIILCDIGTTYFLQKNYTQAKIYLDSSLTIAKGIGVKEAIQNDYNTMATFDSATGNYKTAFEDYKKSIIYRDSILNDENKQKIVQSLMNSEFTRKNDSTKAEQDKKDTIAEKESQKQKFIRDSFMMAFALMMALAFFIYRGYRQKQAANIIITQQKEEVENQKQKIDAAFRELNEKHKEITDSINYAKRIQQALFKDEEYVTLHLPEHFILFKPRDVVSGDFYWGYEKEGHWYIAAVDCTGHGVPGAFLTMLGSAFLNEICSLGPLYTPAEVLNQLRDKITKELSGHGDVKDGMDISLGRINIKSRELQWAGANNPLCYIQDNKMKEINADKQPVGYQQGQKPFTNHIIQLKKNDIIYLFTDGYADQFGGPRGKKLKYKAFTETLISMSNYPLKEQKLKFGSVFDQWKGSLEQVDDILIIGIRV